MVVLFFFFLLCLEQRERGEKEWDLSCFFFSNVLFLEKEGAEEDEGKQRKITAAVYHGLSVFLFFSLFSLMVRAGYRICSFFLAGRLVALR